MSGPWGLQSLRAPVLLSVALALRDGKVPKLFNMMFNEAFKMFSTEKMHNVNAQLADLFYALKWSWHALRW